MTEAKSQKKPSQKVCLLKTPLHYDLSWQQSTETSDV